MRQAKVQEQLLVWNCATICVQEKEVIHADSIQRVARLGGTDFSVLFA